MSRLSNACNGKTFTNGGLNAPEFKTRLMKKFPDHIEEIKKLTDRKSLEIVCLKLLSALKQPIKAQPPKIPIKVNPPMKSQPAEIKGQLAAESTQKLKTETNIIKKKIDEESLDLSIFDKPFFDFALNQNTIYLNSTLWRLWKIVSDPEVIASFEKNLKNLDERFKTSGLGQLVTDFKCLQCISQPPVIKSPRGVNYTDMNCFKVQGQGSKAFIIQKNNENILKGNYFKKIITMTTYENLEFANKFSFLKEAWVNDYIRRKIYNVTQNISGKTYYLCHNFVKNTDIFLCDTQLPHNQNDPEIDNCTHNYLLIDKSDEYFGYIGMELVDGTLADVEKFHIWHVF
jgi:hypothetical protein